MIRCNNGGVQTTNYIGDSPGFPEPVWYDPGGVVNIISLKRAKKATSLNITEKMERNLL